MSDQAHERFLFLEVKGLAKDTFEVVSFSGTEAISSLFQFDLDVISPEQDLDFQSVLGKPGQLRIRGIGGERHVHGIVRRIEETSRSQQFSRFSLTLVPSIWKLSLRQTSRIFQEKSITDVAKQVLKDAGVPSDELKITVHGDHTPWVYCVQYRESDLTFVSRLLEQEGIFYFFQQDDSKAVLRLGDDPSDHPPCPDVGKLPVRPSAGMVGDEETVTRFGVSEEVRPDAAAVRDYNFEKPQVDLTGTAKEGPGLGTEIYDAPGEYEEAKDGREIAKLRLQEVRATRRICSGETTCNRMIPGHLFEIEKHARKDLNRKYMLLQVSHHGSQPQVLKEEGFGMSSSYSCTFQCIPSDVPYRPPRVAPRPLAQGAQTAVVVGPQGEEIYTDRHGRIKVQFHWDREGKKDENSSCWMRVAQTWAGKGWGAISLPRIGQEVIVEFLDGDPDQPIVTGSVYNADNPPPYGLPDERTKSTIKSDSSLGGGGYNEIRFEDAKGKEEIFLHGQKDWNVVIENNETDKIGVDRTVSVGRNEDVTIGQNRTEKVGGNQTVSVGANKTETVQISSAETIGVAKALTIGGLYQVSVGGAMNETVGGAKAEEVGGAKVEAVGLHSSETVGGNKSLKISKRFTLEAGDEIALKTGSAQIVMKKDGTVQIKGSKISIKASGDITIKGSKVSTN